MNANPVELTAGSRFSKPVSDFVLPVRFRAERENTACGFSSFLFPIPEVHFLASGYHTIFLWLPKALEENATMPILQALFTGVTFRVFLQWSVSRLIWARLKIPGTIFPGLNQGLSKRRVRHIRIIRLGKILGYFRDPRLAHPEFILPKKWHTAGGENKVCQRRVH